MFVRHISCVGHALNEKFQVKMNHLNLSVKDITSSRYSSAESVGKIFNTETQS